VGEYAGQSIFHSLVAALVIEALVRLWKIDQPAQKLWFRSLSLAVPLLLVPALVLFAPARAEPAFAERWALFCGTRWADIRVGGVGLYGVWLFVLSAMGAALLALDFAPLVKDLVRSKKGSKLAPAEPGSAAPLERLVTELATRLGMQVPRLVLTGEDTPHLFCAGVSHPRIVISRGAVALLDPAELRAALAHELGHLWRRDPLWGWGLAFARLLLFFNPVFHLEARAFARDAEWRADDFAAAAAADRLALASGFLKLTRAARLVTRPTLIGAPLTRARGLAVETRCRRLLSPRLPAAAPFVRLRLSLTALCLSTLLFFVV